MKTHFDNGLLLTDADNSTDWGLEVYAEEGAHYVAFVTHAPDGIVSPFPTLDREQVKKLIAHLTALL
jgi:hypothetical protein